MAQQVTNTNVRPMRQRGNRRAQVARELAASVPAEYFAPERRWIAERGPQIARVAQQVKMLTAIVNAEKQFYDVGGSVNPAVTSTAQLLTGIPESDDTQARQGRSIVAKELEVRLNFYSATAATTSQTVRVFVIKDNSPNGAVPGVAGLFQGGAQSVNGLPVLDQNQGRFKWLFDETFVLSTLSGGSDAKVLAINLKLDHHIYYVGTAGATTAAGQGTLWLYVLADQVATNASTGVFYSRLRYYDN